MGLLRDYLQRRDMRQQGEMVQEAYQKSVWDQVAAPKYPGPGSQAGLFGMDPMTGGSTMGQPQQTIPFRQQGLMNPMQQEQFAVDVMSQPAYRGQGAQMLNDNWNREWSKENMTAYQQAMVGTHQVQNSIANMNALHDDKLALMKDYRAAAAPYVEGLERYESTMNTIGEVGGLQNMNPAMQMAMIVDYTKLAKPGEQLTEGEFKQVLDQTGIPGLFNKYTNMLQGKGYLGIQEMTDLVNAMSSMAKTRSKNMEEINTLYDETARTRGIPGEYRRPAAQFAPGTMDQIAAPAPPAPPGRGTTNIQTPQPVTRMPGT